VVPEIITVFDVLSSLRCPLHQPFRPTTASLTPLTEEVFMPNKNRVPDSNVEGGSW
jgi:hypothetical protein